MKRDALAPAGVQQHDVRSLVRALHELRSAPGVPTQPFDRAAKASSRSAEGIIELPGEGARTRILCAAYDYDHEVALPLMQLLPEVLHVPAGGTDDDGASRVHGLSWGWVCRPRVRAWHYACSACRGGVHYRCSETLLQT